MLNDLPKFVQKQILIYLDSNNLSAAKTLYDAWLSHQKMQRQLNLPPSLATHSDNLDYIPLQQASLLAEIVLAW